MKLYNYWRSSCSWRVRIVLALKGLAYEYIAVHLLKDGGEQHQESYKQRNPLGEVPCLEVEEAGRTVALSQSQAIIAYLDEKYPTPALLPGDLIARARARQCAEMINAGVQPLHNLGVLSAVGTLGGDKTVWAAQWIRRGLAALERVAQDCAGLCLVGDAVTIADVFLVPQLAAARRFDVDIAAYATLARVNAHLAGLKPFQVAHADCQVDAQQGPRSP